MTASGVGPLATHLSGPCAVCRGNSTLRVELTRAGSMSTVRLCKLPELLPVGRTAINGPNDDREGTGPDENQTEYAPLSASNLSVLKDGFSTQIHPLADLIDEVSVPRPQGRS
jgi:hypothetical protein